MECAKRFVLNKRFFLRKDYVITGHTRDEMKHDKNKLYEIGGVREGLVNKWNKLK